MRGIISRVDIVWTRDNGEIMRVMGISIAATTQNRAVYRHLYNTTEPLMLNDTGTVFECEVIINANSPVLNSDNFTLEVAGKLNHCVCNVDCGYVVQKLQGL